MRATQLLLYACLCLELLVGCDRPATKTTAPNIVPTQNEPPLASTDPPAGFLAYRCESGETLTAKYLDGYKAVIAYKGEALPMTGDMSASGAHYVGDTLEWWTKGGGRNAEALLLQHESDGETGATVEICQQTANGVSPEKP